MGVGWRCSQTMTNHAIAYRLFRKSIHVGMMMSKQDHFARLVSARGNERFERITEDCVILKEDRSGQTLVDYLAIGLDMAEGTGQLTISQMLAWTMIPAPLSTAVHLGFGPGGQAIPAIDADQDLGLEAHLGQCIEERRAAGLVAVEGEYEDGPAVDVLNCHKRLITKKLWIWIVGRHCFSRKEYTHLMSKAEPLATYITYLTQPFAHLTFLFTRDRRLSSGHTRQTFVC